MRMNCMNSRFMRRITSEHLELLVREERVALRQHRARAAQDALAVRLRVEGSDLAVGARGHPRDEAVDALLLVHLRDLVVEPADVERHQVGHHVER